MAPINGQIIFFFFDEVDEFFARVWRISFTIGGGILPVEDIQRCMI